MMQEQWLPNFLGIGGQRCGSTWLHYNLLKHPEMWLPPIKELHYFDRSTEYASPSYLATDRLSGRLFGREEHNQQWRRRAKRDFMRGLTRHSATLPWKMKYYLGRYNDEWYASLFKPGRYKVSGEVTPAYSILNKRDITHIHSLMPRAKIILFLRYPIDRIWSSYRKNFITESDIREGLTRPELDARSDYLSIMSTWESVYPKEQILVEFYDDIEAAPETLLRRIYKFLGVDDAVNNIWSEVHERHNSSPQKSMPQDLKLALTRKYEPHIAELSERMGSYATKWLERARKTIHQLEQSGVAA